MTVSWSLHSAATIVLAREGAGSMQLLFVQRNPGASAFGGAYVFPGGTLEQGDGDREIWQRTRGLSADEADRRMNLPEGALSYWVAAVRECYEEAGILLAVDRDGRTLAAERIAALAARREALNRRELTFREFLLQEDLYIPAARMVYFAHWITPPVHPRRFDTRFFVTLAPPDQEVQHDNTETVESRWMSPREALEHVKNDEIKMVRATQAIVASLGQFASPADAIAQLAARPHVPMNRPCVAQGRDGPKFFRHGDAAYAEVHWVDPGESGASTYDMLPDVPKRLDRYVTRVLAPNPGFMTGPGTNSYLVGERELIAIDPGPADHKHIEALAAAAAGRLRWIVLTHTHRDHSPGAVPLHEATGAPVAGRAARADSPHDAHVPLDRVLCEGDVVQADGIELRVLHTPGHASNHLCYLLPETRMLFTGDHVVQGSTVVIAPPDGNMNAYLRSLERLKAVDVVILAPGHGYLIGQPHLEVTRLIAHRLAREAKVRAALHAAGGSATLEALLPKVYDDVPAAIHPVAARSLRAHLEKLLEDGELRFAEEHWTAQQPSAP
jgi:glyoxylase-like metal-dependent hydrolase (beta-lactamase superfamily II)/8-oxo-dGTP pyrophosphatase MutT (NUDIX family)